ncbi:MAG: hypothetical protein AB8G15_16150 [Saprospiraceae bacterium]
MGQHNIPTDPDLLWQKIQAKQAQKKKSKRRIFFFWLFGGNLFLVGLIALYFFAFSNTNNTLDTPTLSKAKKSVNTIAATAKDAEPKTDLEKIELKKSEAIKETKPLPTNPRIDSNTSTEDKGRNTSFDQNTTVETSTSKSSSVVHSNKNTVHTLAATTVDPALTKPTKNIKLHSNSDSGLNNDNQKSTHTSTPKEELAEITVEAERPINSTAHELNTTIEKSEEVEQTSQITTDENAIHPPAVKKETATPSTKETLDLNSLTVDSTMVEEKIALTNPLDATKEKDTAEDKKNRWLLSNGISFSYGRAIRTLSDRETGISSNYLLVRNDTETSLDVIQLAVDFRLQHQKGFYFKSGLAYEQINERFDYYNERDSIGLEENQVLTVTIARDSSSMETIGLGEVVRTNWERKKIYNHYRSIDIPLLVGYSSKPADNRIGWFVEAGVSVNLWFKGSGQILDANDRLVQLAADTDLFKPNIGISLLSAAGLTYQLTNQFSLWASPEVRYKLNAVTSDRNALEQRYLNVGLGIGIRYHWGKK